MIYVIPASLSGRAKHAQLTEQNRSLSTDSYDTAIWMTRILADSPTEPESKV